MDNKSLIEIQKNIYLRLKLRASEIEGGQSSELLQYREDYEKLGKAKFEITDEHSLIAAIKNVKVCYFGDFHTFDQNTRNVLRVLRSSIKEFRNSFIGIELVHAKDQDHLNSYLDGHLTELEFLEQIEYQDSWRFPWGHYKEIFDFAKEESIELVALNSDGSLIERDLFAAKIINKKLSSTPDSKFIVLFGEYHIVNDKLPKQVELLHESKASLDQLIVHQNIDELYWPLAKMNRASHVSVLKFSENEFSIQSSPPWIKYESMLYWYENIIEDPEFDIHEIMLQAQSQNFTGNTQELFILLNEIIYEYFFSSPDQEAPRVDFEDFNLYDGNKLDFILDQIELIPSDQLKYFYRQLIEESKSFKLPASNIYYCPNYSINRLGYLCGTFLLAQLNQTSTEEQSHNDKQAFFYHNLQKNMCGYLASKVVNPYRKTDLYLDLSHKSSQEFVIGPPHHLIAKQIIDAPTMIEDQLKSLIPLQIFSIAKTTGYLCAEILFSLLRSKSPKAFSQVAQKLFTKSFDENDFFEVLKLIETQVDIKNTKKRFF